MFIWNGNREKYHVKLSGLKKVVGFHDLQTGIYRDYIDPVQVWDKRDRKTFFQGLS